MPIIDMFFSFKGRIGRLAYLGANLVLIIVVVIVRLVVDAISKILSSDSSSGIITLLSVIGFALLVVAVWASLAITVKRLHDRDKSGWWIFIGLIPAIGSLWLSIELLFLGGTDGSNSFDIKTSLDYE